jgi:hypothetical protein
VNDKDDLIAQLLALLRADPSAAAVPEELAARIAVSPAAGRELTELAMLVRDEKPGGHANPVCTLVQAALPAYVDARQAGVDVAAHYALVHHHLAGCDDCRSVLDEMLALEAVPAPAFRNFAAQLLHRPDRARAAQPQGAWWLPLEAHMYHLVTEIEVIIGKTQAAFRQLGIGPTPTTLPALALRTEGEARSEQLIELPHPSANILLGLRLGPVVADQGTVIVEVMSNTPRSPIGGARITLRDEMGGLLERAITDERGVAVFAGLEAGKYRFAVEWQAEQWLFAVTIAGDTG